MSHPKRELPEPPFSATDVSLLSVYDFNRQVTDMLSLDEGIFCRSKELSLEVAKSFGEWLPTVIQECSDPFISIEIDKGEPWFEMIRINLA